RGTMTLADLVDLEAQLARDRSADPAALEGRDTGSFPEAPRDRGVLIARWLQARRDAEPGQLYPGRAVANVLRGIRAALLIAGLSIITSGPGSCSVSPSHSGSPSTSERCSVACG